MPAKVNDLLDSWSPDGRQIAFISDAAGTFEIYAMNTDGSAQTQITKGPESHLVAWGTELEAALGAACDEAQATLTDLRGLAHGIYPAILAEAGLGPALMTLAAGAPVAVELGEVAEERLPPAVESAAYVVVSEAVADGTTRHATYVAVTATRKADQLVIDVRDDGRARSAGLVHIADRVGALGGTVQLGGTDVRAEIPCA